MVALRALHAHAEEDLAGRLGPVVRGAADAVVVGRALGEGAPLGRDHVANEFIDRLAVAQCGTDPVVEAPHPLVVERVAVDPQQVAPLDGPEVDELGSVEHLVDRPGPLVRPVVREELANLLRRRQCADRVEVQPAQELLVGRERRGRDPQVLPPGDQFVVDEVVPRQLRVLVDLREGQRELRDTAAWPPKRTMTCDSPLAFAVTRPSGVDWATASFKRIELGDARDVLDAAIAPRRGDRELLRLARIARRGPAERQSVWSRSAYSAPVPARRPPASGGRFRTRGRARLSRSPPPCSIISDGFRSRMLRSGSDGTTRRPSLLCTICAWSNAGSNPNSESRNPPRPCCAPWQPPELHPALVRIGSISRTKLTGSSLSEVADGDRKCSASHYPLSPWPWCSVTHRLSACRPLHGNYFGSLLVIVAVLRERSRCRPSAYFPRTIRLLPRSRPVEHHAFRVTIAARSPEPTPRSAGERRATAAQRNEKAHQQVRSARGEQRRQDDSGITSLLEYWPSVV